MNNKCIYFRIRSKKYIIYFFCVKKKKNIDKNECKSCNWCAYKKYVLNRTKTPLKKVSKKLGYDGLMVGTGKNTDLISFKSNNLQKQNVKNKYSSMKELIEKENSNYDGNIKIVNNISGIDNVGNLNNSQLYHKAVDIFNSTHNKNEFINNGKTIIVSNSDIKESINKIYTNKLQNKYVKEHLQVFSDLGDIIEQSKLVNQVSELKERKSNKVWSYYINGLDISGTKYFFEFDVVSKEDGKNHYRVQRLEILNNKKSTLPTGSTSTPDIGQVDLYDRSIPQSNNKVKSLPTAINNYSMQKGENNVKTLPKVVKTQPNDVKTFLPKSSESKISTEVGDKTSKLEKMEKEIKELEKA